MHNISHMTKEIEEREREGEECAPKTAFDLCIWRLPNISCCSDAQSLLLFYVDRSFSRFFFPGKRFGSVELNTFSYALIATDPKYSASS